MACCGGRWAGGRRPWAWELGVRRGCPTGFAATDCVSIKHEASCGLKRPRPAWTLPTLCRQASLYASQPHSVLPWLPCPLLSVINPPTLLTLILPQPPASLPRHLRHSSQPRLNNKNGKTIFPESWAPLSLLRTSPLGCPARCSSRATAHDQGARQLPSLVLPPCQPRPRSPHSTHQTPSSSAGSAEACQSHRVTGRPDPMSQLSPAPGTPPSPLSSQGLQPAVPSRQGPETLEYFSLNLE